MFTKLIITSKPIKLKYQRSRFNFSNNDQKSKICAIKCSVEFIGKKEALRKFLQVVNIKKKRSINQQGDKAQIPEFKVQFQQFAEIMIKRLFKL